MLVMGEAARGYNVVRLDSFAQVNDGPLVSADDQTGVVQWKDKADEARTATFGSHMIRIVPRGHGR